jgi:phenylpropionate dioxygenase-like ring-hydroxylating dioxygenase large terminal subunit
MGMIDHWHPAIESRRLRRKPIGIKIAGRELVLFRTKNGQIGCLDDVCPHRRMRLSLGWVADEKLVCPYHGWTFGCNGEGESPSTPKLYACTDSFATREVNGFIWIKPAGVEAPFPEFESEGFRFVGTLDETIRVPLETCLDNFAETEHTSIVHAAFGYDINRMQEVKVDYEWDDSTVWVKNAGPCHVRNPVTRRLMGIHPGDNFNSHYSIHFSPIHQVIHHWWTNPVTGKEGLIRYKIYLFFTPVDQGTTRLSGVLYAKSGHIGPAGGLRLFGWYVRKQMRDEIQEDIEILENLADQSPSMEGMKLSRFDKVLGLTRERIQRLYRGPSDAKTGRTELTTVS